MDTQRDDAQGSVDADAPVLGHAGDARPLPMPVRCGLLVVGVAIACAGSAALASALSDEPAVRAVLTMPLGAAFGLMLAIGLVVIPARRAREEGDRLSALIRGAAGSERTFAIDDLARVDPDHPMAGAARAAHELITTSHRDRLEAARLRRDLAHRVDTETRRATAVIAKQAETDELTGLLNRRGFDKRYEELTAALIGARRRGVLAAFDMDRFKSLNDTFGHEAGDEALRIAGELVRANLRDGDLAGRVGGDEFLVLMPDTEVPEACAAVERLASLFDGHPASSGYPGHWPTISAGVACLVRDAQGDAEELRRLADGTLYAGKKAGRARCLAYAEARRSGLVARKGAA